MADRREFCREYRHFRPYVENWMEESEPAQVYNMLLYKLQVEVQAEEQKRGRYRTVVKVLVPRQSTRACCNGSAPGQPRPTGSTP